MNPYKSLEERAFWSPAIAKRNMFDVSDLWRPRFKMNHKSQIVTFGSCFAQHFSRALVARGFTWYDAEPAPAGLSAEDARTFNYGIFSARTGNIYTTSLLLQWTEWALGYKVPPDLVWEKGGRFFDPFRPQIEPDGFASRQECLSSRELCIAGFRRAILNADTFVFTLGLTESWVNAAEDYEYPVCPGAVDEGFSQPSDTFVNQRFAEIHRNLRKAITLMRQEKRGLRFLLTVSPVPLTATNSGNHVLVATMESKSRLRTVAGELADELPLVDYFPSYEIINAPPFRGTFFESNQRNVNPHGVDFVMRSFFEGLTRAGYAKVAEEATPQPSRPVGGGNARAPRKSKADLVCEEEMLAAFGPVDKQPVP
mgnify:CR=1 FL=1